MFWPKLIALMLKKKGYERQMIHQALHVHMHPHIPKSLCGFIFSIAEWIFLTLHKNAMLSCLTS